MIANLIAFIPGSGGNFLARVLTLNETFVGLGPNGLGSSLLERKNQYNYENLKMLPKDYNKRQPNNFSNWVLNDMENLYFPLKQGLENISKDSIQIIEPIHPDFYYQKLKLFGQSDYINHFYIDPTNCIEWINKQRLHKGAYYYTNAIDLSKYIQELTNLDLKNLNKIKNNFSSLPVYLEKIINSYSTFCQEYERICKILNISPLTEHTNTIYESWTRTWGR